MVQYHYHYTECSTAQCLKSKFSQKLLKLSIMVKMWVAKLDIDADENI